MASSQLRLTTFLALGLWACLAQDANNSSGNATNASGTEEEHSDPRSKVGISIHGHSGSFTVYQKAAGPGGDRNAVTVAMDAIEEVDAAGSAVGNTGPKDGKHSFSTFASQDFQISKPQSVTLLPGNATAMKVSFQATIGTGGVVKVDVFLVTGNGTAGPQADWNTLVGDLKWNIQLSNWSWCGTNVTCGSGKNAQDGAFLDLSIAIKGSSDSPKPRPSRGGANTSIDARRPRRGKDKNMTYDLGGSIDLDLTNVTTIDNVSTEMPSGYPKMTVKGARTVFVFRFPKFFSAAVYDPLLSTGTSDSVLADATTTTSAIVSGMGTNSSAPDANVTTTMMMTSTLLVGMSTNTSAPDANASATLTMTSTTTGDNWNFARGVTSGVGHATKKALAIHRRGQHSITVVLLVPATFAVFSDARDRLCTTSQT